MGRYEERIQRLERLKIIAKIRDNFMIEFNKHSSHSRSKPKPTKISLIKKFKRRYNNLYKDSDINEVFYKELNEIQIQNQIIELKSRIAVYVD